MQGILTPDKTGSKNTMSLPIMHEELETAAIKDLVENLCVETRNAAQILAQESKEKIDTTLNAISTELIKHTNEILTANAIDIKAAKKKSQSPAIIDRLMLNEKRLTAIAQSIETVINLDDPTGKILWHNQRPNGLKIEKISSPLGVLGMIYESRPNVTIDAAILCLKSHNAVVLRGGSESINSALALHKVIQGALKKNGLPTACVSMIPTNNRQAVGEMLQSHNYIDVIIPRGGKNLIERVMNEAKMPVFGHLEGLCHIYVDKSAKPEITENIIVNAKMRRTGICGAVETLLLDKNLKTELIQSILLKLIKSGCEVVGDKEAQKIDHRITEATEDDWTTEYLAPKISVRMVDNVQDAVNHINTLGSHHTDSIIAEEKNAVSYFLKNVDSGIVMHNASTQFADGGEFGMGAEIGIATGKMHARGPVGLEQLCTYKYLVHGNGQTRPS